MTLDLYYNGVMGIVFLIAAEITLVIALSYFVKIIFHVFARLFSCGYFGLNEAMRKMHSEKITFNEKKLRHYLLLVFMFLIMSISCEHLRDDSHVVKIDYEPNKSITVEMLRK